MKSLKQKLHSILHYLGLYTSTLEEVGGRGQGGEVYVCNQCGRYLEIWSWIDSLI